jgi:hypothetical protein
MTPLSACAQYAPGVTSGPTSVGGAGGAGAGAGTGAGAGAGAGAAGAGTGAPDVEGVAVGVAEGVGVEVEFGATDGVDFFGDSGAARVIVMVVFGSTSAPGAGLSLTTVQPAQLSGLGPPSFVTILTRKPSATSFLDTACPNPPL